MKDNTSTLLHLNEFNTIFGQLSMQGVEFNDNMKTLFLLIILPKSWDIFHKIVSNSAPMDGLSLAMVESSLLFKEVNKKNLDRFHSGNTLYVCGCSNDRGCKTRRHMRHKSSSLPPFL